MEASQGLSDLQKYINAVNSSKINEYVNYYGSQIWVPSSGSSTPSPLASPTAPFQQRGQEQQTMIAMQHNEQEQDYEEPYDDNFDTDKFNQEENNLMTKTRDILTNLRQQSEQSTGNESISQTVSPEASARKFDHESLIELIREYQCLWNSNVRAYKDNTKRNASWKQIQKTFGGSVSGKEIS